LLPLTYEVQDEVSIDLGLGSSLPLPWTSGQQRE